MSDQHLPAQALSLLASLRQLHERYPDIRTLVIALSGGLDSMVLLDLCQRTRSQWTPWFAGGMRALHVHHGLSAHADDWEALCREICAQHAVPFSALRAGARVQACRDAGQSLEAAARQARYEQFEQELGGDEVLLMAHHLDDQAETVLLNLLRGSGARGLSGMPQQRELGQGRLWRPFLASDAEPEQGLSRADLQAWAQHGLRWVEDESNADTSLSRNFLRHQVLPLLQHKWPGLTRSLSRTAQQQAQADELLTGLAQAYLQMHADTEAATLDVAELRRQSPALQALVLRHWLHAHARSAGPRGQTGQWPDWQSVQSVRLEVMLADEDAEPLLQWQGREIRRFRDRLYLMWPCEPQTPAPAGGFLWQQTPDGRLPALVLPGNGTLRLIQSRHKAMRRPDGDCQVLYRHYGADDNLLSGSFECALAGRPRRPLKKILQESDLPPWQRGRVPLIFCGDRLAWIGGVGVCEGFQAAEGETAWAVNWQMLVPDEPE